MRQYLLYPNIPQGQVVSGIISGENKDIVSYIKTHGIELFYTDRNDEIDKFISNHADVNLHHLGDKKIIADSSQHTLTKKLQSIGFDVIIAEKKVSGLYPDDCRLNFSRIGNRLFGKTDICDSFLKEFCMTNGIELINVNQGYCKCSLCIVNENAMITDDGSIKQATEKAGIDCLLISKGDIKLNGHNYGFIGGASALIGKDKLMFFGNLKHHRDYEKIIGFLNKYHCEAVFSEDFELTDIGGMIPLVEEV